MGRNEITYKLKTFLQKYPQFSEEAQAVYLMVEVRKQLDHFEKEIDRKDFQILRFYCDWTLHTEKERNLKHIAPVIKIVHEKVNKALQNRREPSVYIPEVTEFLHFKALRIELHTFLKLLGINPDISKREVYWLSYIRIMADILIGQPIVDPIPEIRLFMFEPSTRNSVRGRVDLVSTIRGAKGEEYNRYTFTNRYGIKDFEDPGYGSE